MVNLTSLVETFSQTLAPTKPQMKAVLSQAKALAMKEGGGAYAKALENALALLDKSFNVQQLIQKLRAQNK